MDLTIGDIRALGDNAAELAMARAEVERLRLAVNKAYLALSHVQVTIGSDTVVDEAVEVLAEEVT